MCSVPMSQWRCQNAPVRALSVVQAALLTLLVLVCPATAQGTVRLGLSQPTTGSWAGTRVSPNLPNRSMYDDPGPSGSGTAIGAIVGAALGYAVGHSVYGRASGLVWVLPGALIGGIIGRMVDSHSQTERAGSTGPGGDTGARADVVRQRDLCGPTDPSSDGRMVREHADRQCQASWWRAPTNAASSPRVLRGPSVGG